MTEIPRPVNPEELSRTVDDDVESLLNEIRTHDEEVEREEARDAVPAPPPGAPSPLGSPRLVRPSGERVAPADERPAEPIHTEIPAPPPAPEPPPREFEPAPITPEQARQQNFEFLQAYISLILGSQRDAADRGDRAQFSELAGRVESYRAEFFTHSDNPDFPDALRRIQSAMQENNRIMAEHGAAPAAPEAPEPPAPFGPEPAPHTPDIDDGPDEPEEIEDRRDNSRRNRILVALAAVAGVFGVSFMLYKSLGQDKKPEDMPVNPPASQTTPAPEAPKPTVAEKKAETEAPAAPTTETPGHTPAPGAPAATSTEREFRPPSNPPRPEEGRVGGFMARKMAAAREHARTQTVEEDKPTVAAPEPAAPKKGEKVMGWNKEFLDILSEPGYSLEDLAAVENMTVSEFVLKMAQDKDFKAKYTPLAQIMLNHKGISVDKNTKMKEVFAKMDEQYNK